MKSEPSEWYETRECSACGAPFHERVPVSGVAVCPRCDEVVALRERVRVLEWGPLFARVPR